MNCAAPGPTRPGRCHGLTLIELVVAMALFATLGLLTWRATSQVIDSRTRVSIELARWRDISTAVQHIELDLLQVTLPDPTKSGTATPGFELRRTADGLENELSLVTMTADGSGSQRIGYRYVDGRLVWLQWPNRNGTGLPAEYPLLDKVKAVRWRFVADGTTSTDWPRSGQTAPLLPAAVELELELPDAGTLTRLFALR